MSPKSKKLARRLLRQNRGTASIEARPWRRIADEDYNGKIPAGTLARFALSDGEWLPKAEHQITLGIKKPHTPRQVKHHRVFGWLYDIQPFTLAEMLKRREVIQ